MQNGLQRNSFTLIYFTRHSFFQPPRKNLLRLKHYVHRRANPGRNKTLVSGRKTPTVTRSPVAPSLAALSLAIDVDKPTAHRGSWQEGVLLGMGIPQVLGRSRGLGQPTPSASQPLVLGALSPLPILKL